MSRSPIPILVPGVHRQIDPPRVDAGWLFLLAGVVLLGAAALIPAADDLSEARLLRDRALLYERLHNERLERHATFLDAVENADDRLVLSLAASQLNLAPTDRDLVEPLDAALPARASVFAELEPDPIPAPQRRRVGSVLERLTTDPASRLWVILAGSACLLVGLMPPVSRANR